MLLAMLLSFFVGFVLGYMVFAIISVGCRNDKDR